ncbi:MAG: hypothetical protein PF904_00335, partial [Kiritimatiellae bacterium]|jgi:hypothetical protein|nr:hypothetical protein [Kiritimatiellia bacterium]
LGGEQKWNSRASKSGRSVSYASSGTRETPSSLIRTSNRASLHIKRILKEIWVIRRILWAVTLLSLMFATQFALNGCATNAFYIQAKCILVYVCGIAIGIGIGIEKQNQRLL